MVSAPAMENRAETPERWSTELDSRSARVNAWRTPTCIRASFGRKHCPTA